MNPSRPAVPTLVTLFVLLATALSSHAVFAQGLSTRVVDPKAHAVPATMGYPYRNHSDTILKMLDLRPGDVAVDIGTGDGWWSEKLAGAVGETGTVYAGEIDPKLVDKLKEKLAKLPQIKPYLCKPDDPDLPDGSCDLAFFSQVYHHLPDKEHVAYLEKLRRIVKPTGRICVIEKYCQIAVQGKDHGTQLSRLAAEAEQAGWIALRYELIPGTGHYIAIFAQKELFAPLTPPKPAPSTNGKPRDAKAAAPLEVGTAEIEITPPVDYRLSGYFYERPSTGMHDPLKAKVLLLRQGDVRAALVGCDLIGVPATVAEPARKAAAVKAGLPVEHVMLWATHTHTGPLFHGALREKFHTEAVAAEKTDAREPIDFAAFLVEKVAAAAEAAAQSLRPVQLEAGAAKREGLSFNRRFHMKDGTVRFNPGKLNPDVVKPAGPIDPDVGMLLLRAADRKPLAGLTVFALHLDTVGGTEFGADYPYYLAAALRKQHGESFFSLFGTGTCGDINHIDVSHNQPQKGYDEAKRIGESLAETVIAETPKLKASRPALAVRYAGVRVPLQKPTAEELAWAEANQAKVGQRQMPFLEEVKLCRILDLKRRGAEHITLPVQVIRLSDEVAVVGLPGEVFVELGLTIKRASPFATTLVIELANDCPAYIPTQKAFAEGSYETVNSRVAPGGGERLVEAAVAALKELAPATM